MDFAVRGQTTQPGPQELSKQESQAFAGLDHHGEDDHDLQQRKSKTQACGQDGQLLPDGAMKRTGN